MKTELTIELSAELIRRGVSLKKAGHCDRDGFFFTIGDLLTHLPKKIISGTYECGLSIWHHNANYWIASYVQYSGYEISHQAMSHESDELIDALYNLAIECADKGYLNKE